MRVKKVNPEHAADTLRYLHAECFPEDLQPGLHGDWWVVDNDGEPVAFAGLWQSLSLPGAGYLCRAGVLPRARGAGLQRRLIDARERCAKRKGWNALITDTSFGNIRSANNLIARGFRLYKPERQWSFDDALYWRKIIGAAG